MPARNGPSHSGGSSTPVVGPNREADGGVSRRAVSLASATAAKAIPATAVMASAIAPPVTSRRRRSAVPPWRRRAMPNPENRLVATSATSHG